jgi:uncharacterized protein
MAMPDQHARPPDRPSVDLPALTAHECWELLSRVEIGRVGVVVDGWPVVTPVNFLCDGRSIVFRTAPGLKLTAAHASAPMCLEADSIESLYRSGWSVLVLGHATEVTDSSDVARLSSAGLQPWAPGARESLIRIDPVQITGRRVPRSWRYPGPV